MSDVTKKKEQAMVIRQEEVAEDIYSMWIKTEAAKTAKPGQFVNLYCYDGSMILPRPISICEIDPEREALRVVYRVNGKGTRLFSKYMAGDEIELMGPLGNGFPTDIPQKKAILIGGGIGIPPMLELAKQLHNSSSVVLGYKSFPFLKEEFVKTGSSVYVATEDGSMGTKGNVIGAIMENNLGADVIFACGPTPMLRAVKKFAKVRKIKCYVSMEERMACGVGACLGCVVETVDVNGHSKVHNARVCKDGPVFDAEEVNI